MKWVHQEASLQQLHPPAMTTATDPKLIQNIRILALSHIITIYSSPMQILQEIQVNFELLEFSILFLQMMIFRYLTHMAEFHNSSHNPKFIIHIVEFIRAPPSSHKAQELRDKVECKWITRLNTLVPHGLNLQD